MSRENPHEVDDGEDGPERADAVNRPESGDAVDGLERDGRPPDALERAPETEEADPDADALPEWDDEYLDRVADALKFNYDLERDRTVEVAADGADEGATTAKRGASSHAPDAAEGAVTRERFDLYGLLRIDGRKQFLHPSVTFARSRVREHLLVRRQEAVERADLERLVDLGHALADEWIEADETHQGTEFTFVLVAPRVTDEVRSFVEGWTERRLLKFGYYGHYEIHLAVVAPEDEDVVASPGADVAKAFTLWAPPEERSRGIFGRVLESLRR